MNHASLDVFARSDRLALTKGPVAVVLAEDQVDVATTLQHHLGLGFAVVVLLADDAIEVPADLASRIERVTYDPHIDNAMIVAINRLIRDAPDIWIYYCYNAEYLFYPFCETRSVREMLAFHTEERRDAMLSYVIDLYADNLDRFPDAVSLEHANLDRSG